jgi:hypothetical protein
MQYVKDSRGRPAQTWRERNISCRMPSTSTRTQGAKGSPSFAMRYDSHNGAGSNTAGPSLCPQRSQPSAMFSDCFWAQDASSSTNQRRSMLRRTWLLLLLAGHRVQPSPVRSQFEFGLAGIPRVTKAALSLLFRYRFLPSVLSLLGSLWYISPVPWTAHPRGPRVFPYPPTHRATRLLTGAR